MYDLKIVCRVRKYIIFYTSVSRFCSSGVILKESFIPLELHYATVNLCSRIFLTDLRTKPANTAKKNLKHISGNILKFWRYYKIVIYLFIYSFIPQFLSRLLRYSVDRLLVNTYILYILCRQQQYCQLKDFPL